MGGVRILELLAPAVAVEAVDWDATYREEMPRVFNYFRYRGFERVTAEDLTSATFEKAWRARDRYRRDRAKVATWLLAIARNVAIDHFRRSRPEVPIDDGALRDDLHPDILRAIFWSSVVGLIENPALISANVSLAEVLTTVREVFGQGILKRPVPPTPAP